MNKNIKALSLMIVLIVGLFNGIIFASADSDLYDITSVNINGVEAVSGTTINDVELSYTTEVEVFIEGVGNTSTCPGGDTDDCSVEVHVKAWIGGYEYDDIEDTSEEFDIEPGVSYKKTLYLEIPEDLDVEDDENAYTLYVEVYDDEESERESYEIFAERPSHSLNIIDVLYDSTVNEGETTYVEVRIENLGEDKEEDVKVEVNLGDLATATDYIDELASFEEDNEDEESSDSAKITLNIPEDTESGYYDLTITVSYNRGYDNVEETYSVWLTGDEEDENAEDGEAKTTISLSSTSLDGNEGEESSFTLTFTNTGDASEAYTIQVNGEEQWASSDVNPNSFTLDSGESEEVTVTLEPEDDAQGDHDFSIQVLNENGELVEDIEMSMTVEEQESSSLTGDTNSILKIGFIILIVLIIIIGLIVAFRKLKDDDDDDDGLEPKEGKTYY